MAAYSIPTATAWPSDFPKPQVLSQSVKKSPRVLESEAGTPTNSRLINPLAVSHVNLVFFCTMCEMQQIIAFYTNELAGGLKPFTIGLRAEGGHENKTVRATLSGITMVSEQNAEVSFIGEIDSAS